MHPALSPIKDGGGMDGRSMDDTIKLMGAYQTAQTEMRVRVEDVSRRVYDFTYDMAAPWSAKIVGTRDLKAAEQAFCAGVAQYVSAVNDDLSTVAARGVIQVADSHTPPALLCGSAFAQSTTVYDKSIGIWHVRCAKDAMSGAPG